MAGSWGIWIEFRAVCNRNMLLHTVCDCDSSALSGNKILKQWDFLQALFLHTAVLLLHCILNMSKKIQFEQENAIYPTTMWLHTAVSVFQDSGGERVVQYSWQTFWNYGWIFHGLMDWDAVGSGYHSYYHAHTNALIRLLPLKCQCEVIWDLVDVSWKGKLRNRNRERQSYCLTNKCWYIF